MSTVLVIDDELAVVRVVTRVLGREGLATITAQSVADATAKLADESIRLVICDVNLGDGTIIDVLAVLDSLGRAVPVVVIAGNPGEAADVGARSHALVRGVVAKPFDLESFRRLVHDALAAVPA